MWRRASQLQAPKARPKRRLLAWSFWKSWRWYLKWIWNTASSYIRNNTLINFNVERTEKLPMGSIKNVVSEPIEGHEDYHMMVSNVSALIISSLITSCKYTEVRLLRQSKLETDSNSSLVLWKMGLWTRSAVTVNIWGGILSICYFVEIWAGFTPTLSAWVLLHIFCLVTVLKQ